MRCLCTVSSLKNDHLVPRLNNILKYVVIDQLLNTSDPACIEFAFKMASDIVKKCSESGTKVNNIDEDFNIVLRVLQYYFLNQNICKFNSLQV